MHKGGIADKVGNRFEARWLTYQLLGLLDGTIQSITYEQLGDEGRGLEFSATREGCTEWHQCKRQTASGTWSIAVLANEGVLAAFNRKIASECARGIFVSSDPAPQLKSLQDKLPAAHTLEKFKDSLSTKEIGHWTVLKDRLHADEEHVFRFLERTDFRTLSELDLEEVLRSKITYWFKGNSDTVAAQFRAWLEDDQQFNRPLGYDQIIEFVRGAGIEPKQYELDFALPGRIRDATTSYKRSYLPLGGGMFRIERAAVRKVLDGLQAGAGVVLVSGVAGSGKSAVIADVLEHFQREGTLHIAFRIDQVGSVATLNQLGEHVIGTAENLSVILEKLAGNKRAVLIVDQADAVSEVSGRSAELRRVVLNLIQKSEHYSKVQVIFVCRTFDLENDRAYRQIAQAEGNVRVDIGLLERAEIDPVIAKLGITHSAGNPRLLALLSLPIGLTLAAQLTQSGT